MNAALPALRPYQVEVCRAVLDSVRYRKGLTFSVEIARQGGKNELSAQMEVFLLTLFARRGGNLVKCSPTFRPQTLTSVIRLEDRLNDAGFQELWQRELGHMVRLGRARQIFLSADGSSHVVGTTAHVLMELDESQDIAKEKYSKDFKPMGASTNVTTVLYGTTWDDSSLLEEVKQVNLELERKDSVKRHFHFDWERVAEHNPEYRAYVEGERARLGEDHPLFMTQYRLLPVSGGGRFFSADQKAQMLGRHDRARGPVEGRVYVAGIDLAGQAEESEDAVTRMVNPRRDSTVVTIGELDFSNTDGIIKEPRVNIVQHYKWTGRPHVEAYPQLVDLLKDVWRCKRVVVDATGIGEGVASFLSKALGSHVVERFKFTAQSKSRLGFELLAAVNAGRVKMYARDGSTECQEFWEQVSKAKGHFRPNQTMNFFVEPSEGHDDFLMSLALLIEASRYTPRKAQGQGSPGRASPAPTGFNGQSNRGLFLVKQ